MTLANHSWLLQDLLSRTKCCNNEVTIILDDQTNADSVECVLDIIYNDTGKVPNDSEEFLKVVEMLQIDSFYFEYIDRIRSNVKKVTVNKLIKEDRNLSETMERKDNESDDAFCNDSLILYIQQQR